MLGLIYVFITPPFETPDEPSHFLRAYGVTEGQLILKNHPRELVIFFQERIRQRHREFYEYLDNIIKKESDRIPNIAFNTSLYSPVPYLGYSAVIKLITLNGSKPPGKLQLITAFYLSRIVSLSFLVGVVFLCSIKLSSSSPLKWPLLWLASTPMVIAQAASINIDTVVFGASMLILLLSIGQIELWRNILIVVITGLVLMMSKPVYAPILLISLVSLICSNTKNKYQKAAVLCIGCGLTLAPALFWNYTIKTNGILEHFIEVEATFGYKNVNPSIQLSQIIDNPFRFLGVILNTFIIHGENLYHQFVGVLSWLDTPVPVWTTVLWAFSAIASLFLSDSTYPPTKRYLLGPACMISAVLCFLMVVLSGYLLWMGVGADTILLQGRYFHVIVAIVMLGISLYIPPMLSSSNRERIKWILIISACIINATGIFKLMEKFWI